MPDQYNGSFGRKSGDAVTRFDYMARRIQRLHQKGTSGDGLVQPFRGVSSLMFPSPISKSREDSSKMRITSNTLIVICAIVVLIAILIALELRIRRSIVHPSAFDGCGDLSRHFERNEAKT